MKKLHLDKAPKAPLFGHFAIIDKETGAEFLAKVYLSITGKYTAWDWLVLTEENGQAKLSALMRKSKMENGVQQAYYEWEDNAYVNVNKTPLIGKPLDLTIAMAKNIGVEGSSTIITDQMACEINNESLEKVGELKEQFLDGAPANFKVSARRDIAPMQIVPLGAITLVATEDGRIFSRTMSPNWLGGQFLTEPYVVDAKGYKITHFGHNLFGGNIPCYDEKNRRVVIATSFMQNVGTNENPSFIKRLTLVPLNQVPQSYPSVPVWKMPEDTKVIHLSRTNHFTYGMGSDELYTIFYNSGGKGHIADFAYNTQMMALRDKYTVNLKRFELPEFDESCIILTSCTMRLRANSVKYHLYTVNGTEVHYITRDPNAMMTEQISSTSLLQVDSKITCMTYDWDGCTTLWIGCENGDLYEYDITIIQKPKLVSKRNVGGKVVSMKQLGVNSMTDRIDYY